MLSRRPSHVLDRPFNWLVVMRALSFPHLVSTLVAECAVVQGLSLVTVLTATSFGLAVRLSASLRRSGRVLTVTHCV